MDKRSGKYQPPSGIEAEAQPGSRGRVLRNRLGIVSLRGMDWAEYEALLRAQMTALTWVTSEMRFTSAVLCRMHKDWLGGIYEWAGEYRTVDASKGGFSWPPASLVAQNMANLESGLLRRHTPFRPKPLPEVARSIAEVHAELLLVHPFQEGNGRLARWLADLMALQAGLANGDYGFVGRGSVGNRSRYLAVVRQGYLMRYDDLSAFFVEALEQGFEAG